VGQILVIEYNDRGPAHGYLVSFSNSVLSAVRHLDLEWNSFLYCRLNLIACHMFYDRTCLIGPNAASE